MDKLIQETKNKEKEVDKLRRKIQIEERKKDEALNRVQSSMRGFDTEVKVVLERIKDKDYNYNYSMSQYGGLTNIGSKEMKIGVGNINMNMNMNMNRKDDYDNNEQDEYIRRDNERYLEKEKEIPALKIKLFELTKQQEIKENEVQQLKSNYNRTSNQNDQMKNDDDDNDIYKSKSYNNRGQAQILPAQEIQRMREAQAQERAFIRNECKALRKRADESNQEAEAIERSIETRTAESEVNQLRNLYQPLDKELNLLNETKAIVKKDILEV
ncbi:MAG: hypothetical protein EZS28_018489 [Streblomastix strix]|uniref:Uncharacterized protein n=1 Tax=Streblomastix strix TaxID=222440 RepID=A0A5J4VTL2_9EUKA|nr:MAG: hypothetical protein EZS28_018489 [Streblomastix strix]